MNKLNKISIVGGGTAGWVAALILKTRFPLLTIEVVRSKKIGIIGVGEGSTEHWNEFMTYIGVNYKTIIQECDSTFKSGIMFKGWSDADYLHSTHQDLEIKNGQSLLIYEKIIAEGLPNNYLNPKLTWVNKIFNKSLADDYSPYNQYHFNTQKLNDFLTRTAEQKGIIVVDDEILDVKFNEEGEIVGLIGEHGQYISDFYIDSTGFKRVLISKMGAKWQSYSKYLKMKSSIVFPLPDKPEINMWTTAQAMDYGWMFNIPVWDRSGNGYIFDSDYITAEQAKQEVETFLGNEIDVGKQINFDPGALDRVWIKNCCAVGISASFVEPLEASSIGSSIQQVFLLMHRLPNYDENTIKQYNVDVSDIMNNIRDFVALHYVTKKSNTNFWRDVSKLELPDTLSNRLERWRKNLPIEDDFHGETSYTLFKAGNYVHILAGLDLFDREAIKHEYDLMHPSLQQLAKNTLHKLENEVITEPSITHRRYLELIRSGII